MKTFYVYLLRICLLLSWVSLDSCHHQPQDNVAPNEDDISFRYKNFLLKNNKPLGFAIIDSLKQEFVLAFGAKNAQGKLIAIDQIFYWMKNKNVIFTYKFSSDFLLSEVNSISTVDKSSIKLVFDKYDLTKGKVSLTVINTETGQKLINDRQFDLDNTALSTINRSQNLSQVIKTRGRLAADGDCNELSSTIKLSSSMLSCMLATAGMAEALEIALAPLSGGASLGLLVLTETTVIFSCAKAGAGTANALNGKCDDESDLSGDALDCSLSFLTGVLSYGNLLGLEDCIAPLEDALRALFTPSGTNKETNSPSSTGGAFGDPHLQTFDGLYYDFQGYGEFIAVRSLTDNFEIQVRQEPLAPYLNRQVTLHTGIAINTGSDKVCVYPDRFYINNTPYSLGDGIVALTKGSVSTSNGLMTIVSDNEDIIKINIQSFSSAYLDYKVTLNRNRTGKVQGLLGNFDQTATNDTQLQTGGSVNSAVFSELYPVYADSWRISQTKSLFIYSNGDNTTTYTKKDFPKSQAELDAAVRQQAETICRQKGLTDEPYLSACILDVAVSGSDRYAVSAIGAQESKAVINDFTVTKFTSFDGLDLIPFGNATIADRALYLTKASDNQAGAIYKKYKVDISAGFETSFDFSMSQPGGITDGKSRVGGDGLAFIIQDNRSTTTPILGGLSMPYNGLPRSLAIEFDTFDNLNYGLKEGPNDIWLNTQGINPNSANDDITLIRPQTLPLPAAMNDGMIHHVTIRYTKKTDGIYKLEMFYDNGVSPYLTADNINIQKTIGAYGSGVYIGFIASTGSAWENHIIHTWSFKPFL